MTVLDDILEASTDSSVSTADLLRKVQIVAHRLGAIEVVRWVKSELAGYPAGSDLPEYRTIQTSVMGVFTGPMRSVIRHQLTVQPDRLEIMWTVSLREPLSEIQALGDLDSDPTREWPATLVQAYEESGVFRMEFHSLFSAHNIITRQSLMGLLDVVRSKAMEFALELQTDYPDAGSPGGPTVASDPELSTTVYNVTNNIFGDGTNVATGSQIDQRSRVEKGDREAFLHAVQALGVTAHEALEFVSAVQEEQSLNMPKVNGFLARVRSGAVALASGVATETAAAALIQLGGSFLGI
ncbi:AbiTii domain-containing protein [Microbacterium thalli]|uniref:AbiTii domain-containing protein n=1 Tax=Microbacterium thalli TaxID=3027921 RepID=A0ABT5SE86_9MICO|nr:hypothetical protein [Microbacterium thalli]MDD7961121.1 hypothetical protein [Microbacterium thalli]